MEGVKIAVGRSRGEKGRWENKFPEMSLEEKRRRWYEDNKDEIRRKARLRAKVRREENPEKSAKEKRGWYLENRDRLRADRVANAEYVRKVQAEYQRNRRRNDVVYRLRSVLRSRVAVAVRKGSKAGRTMDLLGCTIEELRRHLEGLWVMGMSWDNWGRQGWHIDHIRPVDSFDLTDPEQQKICFNWRNLQPLWGYDNRKKSNLYYDPILS